MRPNIIFYFSDQQRWDTLGCYGQKLNVTPNLDRLAAEGIRFTDAYTCQPVCGPARSCLQSGRYATQINCHRNALPLPENITTLADCFNSAGYETAYVGKWHLASKRSSYTAPIDDENFEYRAIPPEHRGGYKDYWVASDTLEMTSHGYDGYVFDGDGKRLDFIGYRADCINDYAIHFLHERKSPNPFFLFISQIEPHHQNDHGLYEGPDGSKTKFADFEAPADLKKGEGDWEINYPDYLGQCSSLDTNVGRLVDTLKEKKLWENTILIYTSDHGSHFKTRNSEYKRSCHDASIHIPLIAVGGPFAGGRVEEHLVSLIDLPITLLDAAGIAAPAEFQGRSLIPLVTGKSENNWDDCVFMQISESEIGRAIRTKKWKYCVRADGDPWNDPGAAEYFEEYLYDLENDSAEQVNLVRNPNYAAVREALAEKLAECMVTAGEDRPLIHAWRETEGIQ